jgi:hypothetical protein
MQPDVLTEPNIRRHLAGISLRRLMIPQQAPAEKGYKFFFCAKTETGPVKDESGRIVRVFAVKV